MACSDSPEHDADHGEADEGDGGSCIALEVPGEATATADPGEDAFHDPAFGQDLEALCGIGPFYDLQFPTSRAGDNEGHLLAAIAAIGKDTLDEGEHATCPAQHLEGAIAVLDVGGMDGDAQQQTQRVDEDVPLATLDLLARVVA